jgi:hypothetical protein
LKIQEIIDKMKNTLIALLLIIISTNLLVAQSVSVVLKNSKVITGDIVEEKPDYIIVSNDIGQVKISRESMESINFNPFIKMKTSYTPPEERSKKDTTQNGYKFILNDRVVVHLKNGNVVSGLLLAKSLDMIMIQTDVGNLTIPKKDLQLLEYVSNEYAERGEVVVVNLTNGSNLEGNIYYEDSDNLTVDTKIGRLTISKDNLRSIEYTGKTGFGETSLIDQYANVSIGRTLVQSRLDVISLGFSPGFGDNYKPGYSLGYENRFLLSESQGFYLSGLALFGLNYFTLNKDNFSISPIPVTAKGGALITSIGGGASLTVYPQQSSFFEFYVSPFLEANLIYKKLDLTYPSFPSQNSAESNTEFKFGVGTKVGIDFLFSDFRIGASYDLHYIFGEEDFNRISLNFVKVLF